MNEIIKIKDLSKEYNSKQLFKSFNINIYENEFVSILGPSGCGKTTLLKLIAGIEDDYTGDIYRDIELKDISLVFQRPIFLHWLNVRKNIKLIGKLNHKDYSNELIDETLEKVGLHFIERQFPKELSGGMQARASIARALINEPKIILFDEPFNGLDFIAKAKIIDLFNTLLINKVNVIMTTHHIEDALLLSNRLVLLSDKPTKILEDIRIDLPYPRIKNKKLLEYEIRIEKTFKKNI